MPKKGKSSLPKEEESDPVEEQKGEEESSESEEEESEDSKDEPQQPLKKQKKELSFDKDIKAEEESNDEEEEDEEEEAEVEDENESEEEEIETQEVEKKVKNSRRFGDVVASILGEQEEDPTVDPILSASATLKRSKSQEQQEKKKRKKKREKTKQKRLLANKDHTLPDNVDPSKAELERRLRKLATRGVVQLFNAINTQQKNATSMDSVKSEAKVEQLSKQNFFGSVEEIKEIHIVSRYLLSRFYFI